MARAKQTELAVLCVLSVSPMTGYAVRAAIRDQLGYFWSESFGQIYPALAALRKAGQVEVRDGSRPGSSTYSVTTAGRERLAAMLAQPDVPAPRRDGLMLRLFFGRAIGPDACRAMIETARQSAARQLASYQDARADVEANTEHAPHHPYWLLTISAGEHSARAAIAWADAALAMLDSERDRFLR